MGAPQLQTLRMSFFDGLQLQPGSMHQLTALTSLALVSCGLQSVPADVALLSTTLRVLDLSGNDDLQIDDVAVDSIVSCSCLRVFGLLKATHPWDIACRQVWDQLEGRRLAYTPAQLSMPSVTQLLNMSNVFLCAAWSRFEGCPDPG